LSNLLPRPELKPSAYLLRPPAPPRTSAPLLYTEEEMETARREATADGVARARAEQEEARRRCEAETRAAVADFLSTARALVEARQSVLREAAEGVADLAIGIAARILRREVETDGRAVVPVLRELLQRAATATQITVRLSPRDHAILLAGLHEIPEATGVEGLRLRADSGVTPGGCVIETEAGSLDARLETQLERVDAALRGDPIEGVPAREPLPGSRE
jgi:flagellar biosynthesis/type III secretory pathway protein FliH